VLHGNRTGVEVSLQLTDFGMKMVAPNTFESILKRQRNRWKRVFADVSWIAREHRR
jgi:hypothetical protein